MKWACPWTSYFTQSLTHTVTHKCACAHTDPSFSFLILELDLCSFMLPSWPQYAFEFVTSGTEVHFYEPRIAVALSNCSSLLAHVLNACCSERPLGLLRQHRPGASLTYACILPRSPGLCACATPSTVVLVPCYSNN